VRKGPHRDKKTGGASEFMNWEGGGMKREIREGEKAGFNLNRSIKRMEID